MVLKCAQQIAALNAVIDALDKELIDNPNWRALADLNDCAAPQPGVPDPVFRRLRLEQALARDPLYRARVRLVETVQMLQQAHASVGQEKPPTEMQISDPSVTTEDAALKESASDDDLLKIRGITPDLRDQLHALSVTQYSQIADWTREDRVRVSTALGLGRAISQQNWIEQAALLVAKRNSEAQSSQSQQSDPKRQGDTSKTFIKSTPRDVIRSLAAHNDTGTHPTADRDQATPELEPHAAVATAAPPSSIAFSPQVVPEPRRARVVTKHPEPLHGGARHDPSATPPPIPETGRARSPDDRTCDQATATFQPDAELPPPIPPKTPAPSRSRFRIRRIKPLEADQAVHPAKGDAGRDANVEVSDPFSSRILPSSGSTATRSEDPIPPPIPDKVRRMALKRRLKSRSPEVDQPNENAERFGKGEQWRDRQPVYVGPDLSGDAEPDPKVYSHTEEARVEIIKPRPGPVPGGALSTATDAESPGESGAGPSGKFVFRRPRKHIFKGLKRE